MTPKRLNIKKVTRTFEITIAVIIFVILLYRLALIYEIVPEEYQPTVFLTREYNEGKSFLQHHSKGDDFAAKASKMTVGIMDDAEAYITQKLEESRIREEMEGKCGENSIYRFFMKWGEKEDEYSQCIEHNLRLKQADKELEAKQSTN